MNLGPDPKIFAPQPQQTPSVETNKTSISYGKLITTIIKLILTIWLSFSAFYLLTRETEFAVKEPLNFIFYNSTVFIHEGGHLILLPLVFLQTVPLIGRDSGSLGSYLITLGGPLLQVLLPTIFIIYFAFRKKFYSLAFCIYWLANTVHQSVSYIADAVCVCSIYFSPFAGFVSGADTGGKQDWVVLLEPFGLVSHAVLLSKIVLGFSILLFIASLILMFLDIAINFLKSFNQTDQLNPPQEMLDRPDIKTDKPIFDTEVLRSKNS